MELDRTTGAALNDTITWQPWRSFPNLSLQELYQVLQLRQRIFVLEQQSFYLDPDGFDDKAWHRLGWHSAPGSESTLVAYARVFAAGIRGPDASFGRLVVAPIFRGTGLGKILVADAIQQCEYLSPNWPIRIQAQQHLERFYAAFGFRGVSEPYDEDGIPHLDMKRSAKRMA